jgi:hypothetical protein
MIRQSELVLSSTTATPSEKRKDDDEDIKEKYGHVQKQTKKMTPKNKVQQ